MGNTRTSSWLFVIALLLANDRSIVSGAIYFPLYSVNITVPRATLHTDNIAPLVRLSLLNENGDSVQNPSFTLIEKSPSKLFYVTENELRIHQKYFSKNFSLEKEFVFYYLVVEGRVQGELPQNMTITVLLSNSRIKCRLHTFELCFWNQSKYQVSEEHDSTVLGTLASPIFSSICPQYSVSYKMVKERNVNVRRTGNGRAEWAVETTDMIDREEMAEIFIRLKCDVVDINDTTFSSNHPHTIKVKVRDTNDNHALLNFSVIHPVRNHIRKGDRIAVGTITDSDEKDTNNITASVESSWPMTITCNHSDDMKQEKRGTTMACDVINLSDGDLKKKLNFMVIARDETLRDGFGQKKRTIGLSLEVEEPRSLPMTDYLNSPIYNKSPVVIAKNSRRGARVFTPLKATYNQKFFMSAPSAFGITTYGGIIFLNNTNLTLGENLINVTWIKNGVRNQQTLQVDVSQEQMLSSCQNNERKSVYGCAMQSSKEDCEASCGAGLGLPHGKGGCFWKKVVFDANYTYFTCTPDPRTCPDSHCDELEEMFPKLCPQDCIDADVVEGTAVQYKGYSRGIFKATGKCRCLWNTKNYCVCEGVVEDDEDTIDGQMDEEESPSVKGYDVPIITNIPHELRPLCDITCQITLCGASVLFAAAILGSAYYMKKYRRLQKRCHDRNTKEELVNINYEEQVRRPLQDHTNLQSSARPDYFDGKWEFPRHRLTIEETIGEGEFGMVLKARAEGIHGQEGLVTVAVKTLKAGAKECELGDLISEYELLKDVDHPNIIKLLGACTSSDGPIYVIIEHAEHGSLRSYLRKHRRTEKEFEKHDVYLEGVTADLTPRRILSFAWQIAKGMAYLAEMKLVHRDLAARNVLLTNDLVCKISDFGLTRDIYEDDTYLKRSKGRVPIKWMALESLADHIYTTKSDVWSFGIVLWELATSANSPYPGVTAQELYSLLQEGYRMERPIGCSTEFYEVMKACWSSNPSHRPSFSALVLQLDTMLAAGRDYLDLNPRAVENRQYLEEPDLQWRFQGYDNPRVPCSCCPQSGDLCRFHGKRRYENEIASGPIETNFLKFSSDTLDRKGDISYVNKV